MLKQVLKVLWYPPQHLFFIHRWGFGLLRLLLLPLWALYRLLSWWNRMQVRPKPGALPSIIVGNLSLGGSGKSPLVAAIALHLAPKHAVAILSRGYGRAQSTAYLAYSQDAPLDARLTGDESAMLARQLQAKGINLPLMTSPSRLDGLKALSNLPHLPQWVVLDDGLQHAPLQGTIRLCAIDALRGLGNKQTLPLGPLRESPHRLLSMDAALIKLPAGASSLTHTKAWQDIAPYLGQVPCFGFQMTPIGFWDLHTKQQVNPDPSKHYQALCALAYGEDFLQTLQAKGYHFTPHILPDHHPLDHALPKGPLLVTEKDASKLGNRPELANSEIFVLGVEAKMDPAFWSFLDKLLASKALK